MSNISLDKDLKRSSAKKNIKKDDRSTIDVLGKCDSYATTSLKILASFRDTDSVEALLNYLYYINIAQIRYL